MKRLVELARSLCILISFGTIAEATTITAWSSTAEVIPTVTNMDANVPSSNTHIQGWAEDQGVLIQGGQVVNAILTPAGGYWDGDSIPTTSITNALAVNSFILSYNKKTNNDPITAIFRFDSPIYALIFGTVELDETDLLVASGASYLGGGSRGLDNSGDSVQISSDLRTIIFTAGGSNRDHVRVFTLTDVDAPEPGSWLLIGSGMLGLGWAARRRRRNS